MRLIDADVLISNQFKNDISYKAFVNLVKRQPTAEPKCGEWTPIHKGERGFSAGDFRCSVCHQPNKCYTMTNYCSHCGAYMKEDK